MTFKLQKYLLIPLSLFMALGQGLASAQTLRIGLAEDLSVELFFHLCVTSCLTSTKN
jgi:hypothetical protein